ncbi:PLD nuclease N-terminal domain-containing protein [Gordonia humi]|uniref:Cardiolipin synthase N-terminal domain-containing protein n=1 Tax=Gordonia humi TaxID=686429 RepID=A0A840EV45_9ACTN|nr:PLD nuclease N-terminal domain-containing protein [Gordonia humi]MBB4134193.1 hypothetical protein [Gordonia humi]
MPYFGLIVLVIWVAALVDVVVADDWRVRHLPKVGWLIIVVLIPLAGSLVWFLVGRPEGARATPVQRTTGFPEYERPRPAQPSNPDDDEEFLRRIRERAEAQRRQAREMEADKRADESDE